MQDTQYDLTKAEMTQIYDRVNSVTDDAKDANVGNETVAQALIELQAELERLAPTAWWVERDEQFDEIREIVRSAPNTETRKEAVISFCNTLTEHIFDGDLRLDPSPWPSTSESTNDNPKTE